MFVLNALPSTPFEAILGGLLSIYSRLAGTLMDPFIRGLEKNNARVPAKGIMTITRVLGVLTMAHSSTAQVVPASCPGAGRGFPCLCAAVHCVDCTPGAGGSIPCWQGASAKQQQQCAQLLSDWAQRRQQAGFHFEPART